jgi:pimeloyl-ACP methyl ester carboxylesterase
MRSSIRRSAKEDLPLPSAKPSSSTSSVFPPLVFIHGFKAGVLSEASGSQRGLTWWQGFGLASPDLRLPLQWDGDVQRHDGLLAIEPLRRVAWQSIYAPFLDWAERTRRFHPFAYDWRRDNHESVDNFVAFLTRVRDQHGGAKVQVVAHSMGGLISFAALNRRPDLFHSALFAGVPFTPGLSFLMDMHVGTAVGLNKDILNPEVLFTFVSPYSFFPVNPDESGLAEQNGTGIRHDWYTLDDWERHKLGVFASREVTAEERAHLRNALRRARDFRRLIVFKDESAFQYPPIAVLVNDTRPNLTTVVRDGPQAVRGWDFRTAAREPGDNRVTLPDAMPPEGVPYTVYKTEREHAGLVNDTRQIVAILDQLSR